MSEQCGVQIRLDQLHDQQVAQLWADNPDAAEWPVGDDRTLAFSDRANAIEENTLDLLHDCPNYTAPTADADGACWLEPTMQCPMASRAQEVLKGQGQS